MRQRTITAVLTVFALMLAVTPAAAETQPGGEATTQMLGAELQIDDVDVLDLLTVDGVDLSALDLSTLATTVEDPFAQVDALPLRVGDQEFGRTTVSSSDGADESGQTPTLDEVVAGIGAIQLHASTTTESAEALFGVADDAVGQIGLLGDATVGVTGLLGGSWVDADGASSAVGLTVDGVALDLGDLLGEDLLAALPLDTLLALAEHLLSEVEDLSTAALTAAQAEVGDAIADLEDLVGELEDDLEALADVLDAVEDDIDEISGDLDDLSVDTVVDLVTTYADECDVTVDPLDLPGTVEALESCLEGLLEDLITELDAAAGDVAQTLSDIQEALVDLENAIGDLLQAILDLLDEALGLLDDLLDDLAGADLLDLGEIAIGMEAAADAEDAEAALACVVGGVDVDCLAQGAEIAGVVNDAIATITGVLGILGADLGVTDGDVVLEIFGQASTSTETGDTNVASAHLEVLRLEIPSITIDVDDTLDGLLGDLEGAVDAVLATLDEVLDGEVMELLQTVDGILDTDLHGTAQGVIDDAAGVETAADGLFEQIDQALADLGDVVTGALPDVAVSTPGLSLVIDPTTTAEFTPGAPAADAPDGDVDLGAPDPDDEPALPTTGGGLVLLALLALAGAAALLRRRPDGAI